MEFKQMLTVAIEEHGYVDDVVGAVARFHPKVRFTEECWEWEAALNEAGYGVFVQNPFGSTLAHRVSYMMLRGPIPDGLSVDHLCRNPKCVNPDHLEAVTLHTNLKRATEARQASKTHCARGHEWDPLDNPNAEGYDSQRCAECHREDEHERYWEGRDRKKASKHGTPDTCPKGHAYTPENRSASGKCKPCRNEYERARRAATKE